MNDIRTQEIHGEDRGERRQGWEGDCAEKKDSETGSLIPVAHKKGPGGRNTERTKEPHMNISSKNTLPSMPPEMLANSVDHKHAGNGWAIVAVYPDEWCSLVALGKDSIGTQFFTAWTKKIKPDKPIAPVLLKMVEAVRKDLRTGKKVIKETRLVDVV